MLVVPEELWLPEEDDVFPLAFWAGTEDDALPESDEDASEEAGGSAVDALPKGCVGSAVLFGVEFAGVFGCATYGADGAAPCTGCEKGVSCFPEHAENSKTTQSISTQSTIIHFFKVMHFPSQSKSDILPKPAV